MSKKYYRIYNVVSETYYSICFETLEDLLRYVAEFQTTGYFGGYKKGKEKENGYFNKWLDGINMTLNDTFYTVYGENDHELRPYAFVDPWFKIIDLRNYVDKIMFYATIPKKKIKWNRLSHCNKCDIPEFRKGPIPMTGVNHSHRGSLYRHPKTLNEMKLNSDVEEKEYVRPKRRPNNLPNVWDEKIRHIDKSWKTNSKKRKQWM